MTRHSRAPLSVYGFSKAPVYLRITAAFIDILIAGLPWFIIEPLWGITPLRLPGQFSLLQGFIVGAALLWSFYYICFRDSFANGQSIGKRCMNLIVVGTWSHKPCTPLQSFLRNALCCFHYVLIVEAVMPLANLKTGRRIGDFLAQTMVTEISQLASRNLK